MRLFFFFRKLLLHKKGAQWLRLEMSPAVNSAEFLHKQMENVCSHKEVTRDPPPLFIQKNFLLCRKLSVMQKFSAMQKVFCYAEKFPLCRNFLLCRKFSVMQKNFLVMLKNCTESFLSYRKISVMQKVFCYAEKFLIKQKIFLSCKKKKNYAESFLVCRKIFFDYAKKKINSCAKKKKKKVF